MPKRSSTSVVIKSLDETRVRRAAAAWAKRLLAEHPEVEEVIFFGSFAKGTWAPGSDLDALLVLRASKKPFRERIPDYLPGAFPVGVDLLPYTRAEIEGLSAGFLQEVEVSTWRYVRGRSAGA